MYRFLKIPLLLREYLTNVSAFLKFRLEISFCISASLICLKLKREKRHSQDKKKDTLVSGNVDSKNNLRAGGRKKLFFINLAEFFK